MVAGERVRQQPCSGYDAVMLADACSRSDITVVFFIFERMRQDSSGVSNETSDFKTQDFFTLTKGVVHRHRRWRTQVGHVYEAGRAWFAVGACALDLRRDAGNDTAEDENTREFEHAVYSLIYRVLTRSGKCVFSHTRTRT
jgi:hypothetical protein